MEDKGAILKRACDLVIADPTLAPEIVKGKVAKTHCNQGARLVAQAMGCSEFDDLAATADIMYSIMALSISGRWKKVDGATATIHALSGGLGFAALPHDRLGEAHGHIAAIYPVSMQRSGSLRKDVPVVANVGAANLEEKESLAFPVIKGEADYFIWA